MTLRTQNRTAIVIRSGYEHTWQKANSHLFKVTSTSFKWNAVADSLLRRKFVHFLIPMTLIPPQLDKVFNRGLRSTLISTFHLLACSQPQMKYCCDAIIFTLDLIWVSHSVIFFVPSDSEPVCYMYACLRAFA